MRGVTAAVWLCACAVAAVTAADEHGNVAQDNAVQPINNQIETEEDKRAWHNLHGGWGKRGWQDLNSAWGKRAWQDLNSAWGKRGWQDLNSAWGKRGWQDLNSAWGKRGWQDLNSAWGKRGWQDLNSAWGKRGWQDLNSAWGKRAPERWANFHGSWGKRGLYDNADYFDYEPTPEQIYFLQQILAREPLILREDEPMAPPEKKAWNNLHGAWGKRPAKQGVGNSGSYYWKREPGWTNLRGMWGKRSVPVISESTSLNDHDASSPSEDET